MKKVVLLFLCFILKNECLLESSFPLTVLPLHFQENPSDHNRLYYSDESILNVFKSSGYISSNSSISTSSFGFATPDTDCEVIDTLCPQLIQIYHVTLNGSPRLISSNEIKDNETIEIIEEAGYIGSWPGYCGTSNGALVELYSPILNKFRYATSNEDILIARWNTDRQFWRPTKVIGYLFDATQPKRTINYPFNSIRPLENVVFNKILLRLRPIVKMKDPNGLVAFTTKFHHNKYLNQYKFSKVLNISLIDETTNFTVIEDACGKKQIVYEVNNPITRTYRLKTSVDFDAYEEMTQRAGYVFREESSARRCLGEIQPIYELQNPVQKSEIHYVSSPEEIQEYTENMKWTNLGLLGYTSWGNFAFAKR